MSALAVEGVGLHLGAARILEQVTFTVTPGSRHVITGHNGAGKSSLLNVLAGTIRPTAGKVYLAGRDVTGWAPHRLASAGVARLWQHPQIWETLPVAENLRLAMRSGCTPSRLDEALHEAGLSNLASRPAGQLSYGQRRSLELTIALAQRPSLLILDEPSAGLPPTARQELARQLTTANPDLTIVVTDHDHGLMEQIATHRTELAHGRIVRSGPAWWETTPSPLHLPTPRPSRTQPVVLQVAQLSVHRNGIKVLDALDLQVRKSELVALTGPNGSGKTTLIGAVAGLFRSQAGVITLAGQDLTGLSAARRFRAGLHTVVQDRLMFGALTVAENLRLNSSVNALGLFEQLAGKTRQRAASLSGGEKQMLAIAMSLANQPRVVLLDEPFEGLAGDTTSHVAAILGQKAEQGTAIVVSGHRVDALLSDTAARVIELTIGDQLPAE